MEIRNLFYNLKKKNKRRREEMIKSCQLNSLSHQQMLPQLFCQRIYDQPKHVMQPNTDLYFHILQRSIIIKLVYI